MRFAHEHPVGRREGQPEVGQAEKAVGGLREAPHDRVDLLDLQLDSSPSPAAECNSASKLKR